MPASLPAPGDRVLECLRGSAVHRGRSRLVEGHQPNVGRNVPGACTLPTYASLNGLAGRGIVDGGVVDGLWQSFLNHEKRTTWSRLWALVALDAWLEATGVTG